MIKLYSVHVRARKAAGESVPVTAVFRGCEVFGFSHGRSIISLRRIGGCGKVGGP
jgi:hypothetical protein